MKYIEEGTLVSDVGFLVNFCKVNNSLPNCEDIITADIFLPPETLTEFACLIEFTKL